ncbi:hypothetical protein ACFL1X_03525 [Candidatus Hydrogenedentota bacterium]
MSLGKVLLSVVVILLVVFLALPFLSGGENLETEGKDESKEEVHSVLGTWSATMDVRRSDNGKGGIEHCKWTFRPDNTLVFETALAAVFTGKFATNGPTLNIDGPYSAECRGKKWVAVFSESNISFNGPDRLEGYFHDHEDGMGLDITVSLARLD